MAAADNSFNCRVYYAARDGMAITLYALLSEQPAKVARACLRSRTRDADGQLCTPLVIAARNGHERAVRMLVSKFEPDLEQEATVKFDGYVIDGASALWCAAGAGHLGVVRTLVRRGADVNHVTRTRSTPLRAACFDGRLDIVRFLVESGADWRIANKYDNTCLMIASYKGYDDVTAYLLRCGAEPNARAACGATALHFAAECGHVGAARALLVHGADAHSRNEHGMTPLLAAAERTRSDIVDFLLSETSGVRWRREQRVEALELLGASFANDKENYDLERCYRYFRLGLLERYDAASATILELPKPPPGQQQPIGAYDNSAECATLDALAAIEHDAQALHMQGLVVRERILGPGNPEVPHPVVFRGAVFADASQFDRCVALWLHALRLRQRNRLPVAKDLLRFTQVFAQMMHTGVQVALESPRRVLAANVVELERSADRWRRAAADVDERDAADEELDANVHNALYLLVIVAKLMRSDGGCDRQEALLVHREVYKLNRLAPRTRRQGRSLLHLAASAATPVDDFHTSDVCRFPSMDAVALLLRCGADADSADDAGDTPLHLIARYRNALGDFATLHGVVALLVDAGGAHVDAANRRGRTPLDDAASAVAQIVLRARSDLSLKCMAAKAVRRFGLAYRGHVPRQLEAFVELHGVPTPGLD